MSYVRSIEQSNCCRRSETYTYTCVSIYIEFETMLEIADSIMSSVFSINAAPLFTKKPTDERRGR